MRTLLVTLMMLASLPAMAAHEPFYASARDSRGLAREAQQLDDVASAIFRDLYSRHGRSQVTHQARELAEATRGFRRQVARGAPYGRLYESYRRVGNRYAALERRLGHYRPYGWNPRDRRDARGGLHVRGMRAFEREYHDVGASLQRLAWHGRERRHPDRHAWERRDDDHRRDRPRRFRGPTESRPAAPGSRIR